MHPRGHITGTIYFLQQLAAGRLHLPFTFQWFLDRIGKNLIDALSIIETPILCLQTIPAAIFVDSVIQKIRFYRKPFMGTLSTNHRVAFSDFIQTLQLARGITASDKFYFYSCSTCLQAIKDNEKRSNLAYI